VAIWYILWLFDMFFPVLVCCTEENLATLARERVGNFPLFPTQWVKNGHFA
jgi:hypothetical protein